MATAPSFSKIIQVLIEAFGGSTTLQEISELNAKWGSLTLDQRVNILMAAKRNISQWHGVLSAGVTLDVMLFVASDVTSRPKLSPSVVKKIVCILKEKDLSKY